jgi:hypothetical protein
MDSLRDGVLGLGVKIFHSTVTGDQNGIIAPGSLAVLLGILYCGTYDETRQELLDILLATKDSHLAETVDDNLFARWIRAKE